MYDAVILAYICETTQMSRYVFVGAMPPVIAHISGTGACKSEFD